MIGLGNRNQAIYTSTHTIMKPHPQESIFDVWTVYDQILDRNYMFHQELFSDVRKFLNDQFAQRSISILDLGCGSDRHLAPTLQGFNLAYYRGYDLSETALKHAEINLAGISPSLDFRQENLLKGLKANNQSFNLIFSSFALHHLNENDKAAFFRYAWNGLEPQSVLLLIDVMREESESLDSYLDHYCTWIRSKWSFFAPEVLDAICEHVLFNDFPEKSSSLRNMAFQAGFDESMEISRYRWHQLWCFKKAGNKPGS